MKNRITYPSEAKDFNDRTANYLLAKIGIQAVTASLYTRRDVLIQKRNPSHTDLISDLTALINELERALMVFISIESDLNTALNRLYHLEKDHSLNTLKINELKREVRMLEDKLHELI